MEPIEQVKPPEPPMPTPNPVSEVVNRSKYSGLSIICSVIFEVVNLLKYSGF